MIKIKVFTSLIALYLLSFNVPTFAESRSWYSVEYIIFENTPLSNQQLEPWTKEPFQMPRGAIQLKSSSNGLAFSRLSSSQKKLHGIYNRLKKLSSYNPIAHGGWIQSLKAKERLRPIKISRQLGTLGLEGTITFHRRKYLHLDVNLQLSKSILPEAISGYNSNRHATLYRLKETRRIKTSDSHYFDHPRFGIIVVVEKIHSRKAATPATNIIKK